jgi:hypothetical protein
MSSSKDTSQIDSCGHMFHEKCLGEWLKVSDTCPLCRGTAHSLINKYYYINIKVSYIQKNIIVNNYG